MLVRTVASAFRLWNCNSMVVIQSFSHRIPLCTGLSLMKIHFHFLKVLWGLNYIFHMVSRICAASVRVNPQSFSQLNYFTLNYKELNLEITHSKFLFHIKAIVDSQFAVGDLISTQAIRCHCWGPIRWIWCMIIVKYTLISHVIWGNYLAFLIHWALFYLKIRLKCEISHWNFRI